MAQTSEITLPTPVRHRKHGAEWSFHRAVREVREYLHQPVRATRAQHAKVAGLYGAVAVLAGLITSAVVR